jgi:hypothetical protein
MPWYLYTVRYMAQRGRKSKQFIMQETFKCTADPLYYLHEYGKVLHPKKGKVKMEAFPFQSHTIKQYQQHRFNIILKTRQLGLSTVTAGYVAWLMLFHNGQTIAVVANKEKVAQNFVKKVRLFIKNTPTWLNCGIKQDNATELILKNDSMVGAHATTSDSARSEAVSLLIIDEAAIIDSHKVDDLWAAVFPTLSLGGNAIVISTPKGQGNWYHKQWVLAEGGESDFNPIRLHWTQHPWFASGITYDKKGYPSSPWYESQKRELADPRKVAQELDCDFVGSGDNVIDGDTMKELQQDIKQPIATWGFDNNTWIWEEPQRHEDYIVCADVARGDGEDYSAAIVIKQSTNEQVAEYKGKLPPDMYADLLVKLASMYNKALLACEANNIGYATCLKIVEHRYPNIFYSMPSHFNPRNRKWMERNLVDEDRMVPGFQTTAANRPLLISALEESLRTGRFVLRSNRLYNELKTLIWNNGKAQAQQGFNDDLCMALAIGQLIVTTLLVDVENARKRTVAMLDAFGSSQNTETIDKQFRHDAPEDPYTLQLPDGDEEDLRGWLIDRLPSRG